jgi:flavin reductase (DIM6/NTAB) family NADH-FMN oxidoreductase RutF
MTNASHDPRDPATFRSVMGRYPTGVAVITAAHDDQRIGLVVGSFTSISLDPPLVGFFPGKSSSSWPRIEKSGSFCVNVLGAEQLELCRTFASRLEDKFSGLSVPLSPAGLPLLEGVVAWIECRIEQVCELGDHYLVVGAVEAMGTGESANPLIFAQGSYHGLASLETC